MPVRPLDTEQFLRSSGSGVIIDVRTPAEYLQGHIPGAVNLPLFTNEERAEIGTLYKQQGQQKAIHRGLEIVGPKMAGFVSTAIQQFGHQPLYVHCWRGGMRSSSMAWLLDTAGLVTFTLKGGYKAYRQKVLSDLSKPLPYIVLGGYTGSGKTQILQALQARGEQVIDLEELANHRGSAFGHRGEQPTTEQFANLLHQVQQTHDPNKRIWIEDESRSIGKIYLPDDFVEVKRRSPLVFLRLPQEVRAVYLVQEYGTIDTETLINSFRNIQKRLGGDRVQTALESLDSGDLNTAATIALQYYDKAYDQSMAANNQGTLHEASFEDGDIEQITSQLISLAATITSRPWKRFV